MHIDTKGGIIHALNDLIAFKKTCTIEIISIIENSCADVGIIIAALCNYRIINNLALPDGFKEFKEMFIDNQDNIINEILFKRRIIGLTSYFRSAQEQLMPRYEKSNFVVQKIEMSPFQFGVYEEARINERNQESKSKKNKFLSQIAFKHCINELNGLIKIFLKSQIGLTYNS